MAAPPRTAIPGTAACRRLAGHDALGNTASEHTRTIYTFIEQNRYEEALRAISVSPFPHSRAALSLSAMCLYNLGEFAASAQAYDDLINTYPEVADVAGYVLYKAQALFKAGSHREALDASKLVNVDVSGPCAAERVKRLEAAIAYELDDLATSKSVLPPLPLGDSARAAGSQTRAPFIGTAGSGPVAVPRMPQSIVSSIAQASTLVGHGCILYKEGRFDEARALFETASAQAAPAFKVRALAGTCTFVPMRVSIPGRCTFQIYAATAPLLIHLICPVCRLTWLTMWLCATTAHSHTLRHCAWWGPSSTAPR